jgi:hypothetical protein
MQHWQAMMLAARGFRAPNSAQHRQLDHAGSCNHYTKRATMAQQQHQRLPPLLAALDGAWADVRCIKGIAHKYIVELDQRLPILRLLEASAAPVR